MLGVTKLSPDPLSQVQRVVLLKNLIRSDVEDLLDYGIKISKVGKIFDKDCTPSFASQMHKITQSAAEYVMSHADSVAIMCKNAKTDDIFRIAGGFQIEMDISGSNRPGIVANFTFKDLPSVEPVGYFVVLDKDGYLLVAKKSFSVLEALA